MHQLLELCHPKIMRHELVRSAQGVSIHDAGEHSGFPPRAKRVRTQKCGTQIRLPESLDSEMEKQRFSASCRVRAFGAEIFKASGPIVQSPFVVVNT